MQEPDGKILLFARRCRNKREKDEDVYVEKNDIVAFELNSELKAVKRRFST